MPATLAGRRQRRNIAFFGFVILALLVCLLVGIIILLSQTGSDDAGVTLTTDDGQSQELVRSSHSEEQSDNPAPTEDEVAEELPLLLEQDIRDLAEGWASSISSRTVAGQTGRASVYIYDLDHDHAIASVGAEDNYNTASLYKLFPVYEGYRRIADYRWSGDDLLIGGRTISKCLDAAIRSSDSTCGEALWAKIGHAELDEIIRNDYGITNSNILGLSSNAIDIAAILKRYFYHPDFDDATYQVILDSMLNQPPSAGLCNGPCNWRQGLPAGLEGDGVRVYDKVGWEHSGTNYWRYYHDAAIVETGEHHLIVVVMTANIRDFANLSSFGLRLKDILQNG